MKMISQIFGRSTSISKNLLKVISDPERKDLLLMLREFIRCGIATRCIPVHYFTSFLYRRNVHNVFDYVSRREADEVQEKINSPALADLLTNKLNFSEHFARGGLPVPRLFGYNILDKLYIQVDGRWEVADLSSPQKMKDSFNSLMADWAVDEVFLKLIRGSQGLGALKIKGDHLQSLPEINRLHSIVSSAVYIFQEVVEQHPDLSNLNASSLNTMRIDTFRAVDSDAEIMSAYIRVGGEGAYIDNISAGGVFVGIHLDSGKLKENAINKFHGGGETGVFKASPSSGILFDGYQVPLFDEVKETVIRAAEWIPSALVGWDVAVSSSGPVLIEANILYYGLNSCDLAYGGYQKNPVYQKVLTHADMN